jgi:hypothetical protein
MRFVTRIRGRTHIVSGAAVALLSSLLSLTACSASNQVRSHNQPGLLACPKGTGTFVRPTPIVQATGSKRVARFENAVRWKGGTAIVGMDVPYFGEQVSDSLLFAYHGASLGAPSFNGWFAIPRVARADSALMLVWGEPADTVPRKLAFVPNRLRTLWAATHPPEGGWTAPEKLLSASDISWPSGSLLTSAKTGRPQLTVPMLPEGARQPVVFYIARDAKSWRHVRVPGTDGAVSSALGEAPDGTLVLAFVATDSSLSLDENSLFIATSSNAGATWSNPQLITRGGVRDPVVLFGPDDRLHVLWRQVALREGGADVIRHVATQTLSRDIVWSQPSDLHARPGFFRFTSVIDSCGTIHVVYEDWHGGEAGDVDYASFREGVWSEPVHVLPGWLTVDPFLMIGDRGEISLFVLGHRGTAPARLANYQLVLE